MIGQSLNITIETPRLVGKTKNGQELYIDPSTNRIAPIEVAFMGFESLKQQASRKVYLNQLELKAEGKIKNTGINILTDSQKATIKGDSKPEDSENHNNKAINLFDKKLFYCPGQKPSEDENKQNEILILPYIPFLPVKQYRSFLDRKKQFLEDEEKDIDIESETHKNKSYKRLWLLG